MDVVFLVGRLLLVPVLVVSPLGAHFKPETVEFARGRGAPLPELTVPASGAVMLAGAALIALGLWADLGALLVLATLVPITFFMHRYWKVDDPQQRQMQQTHFLKNLSLIGGVLLVFWVYAEGSDLQLSLSDGLF